MWTSVDRGLDLALESLLVLVLALGLALVLRPLVRSGAARVLIGGLAVLLVGAGLVLVRLAG